MKKYCINLPDRNDRRKQADDEFKKVGLNVDFFPAVKTRNGRDGCRMSHLSLMNMARTDNVFVIFEDDVLFMPDAINNLRRSMLQLPACWDALYLGATLNIDLNRYSKDLFFLRGGWTTHAIIWNNQNGVVDYILNNANNIGKIDVYFTHIQDIYNVFITSSLVATQREGYSDIINQNTDYSIIQERWEKHTK